MQKVKITSDSTCDLTRELIEQYDITTVPLTVTLGDRDYRDGVDITPEDIYSYVAASKNLPKTAAPSPEDYRTFFRDMLKRYDAVIHFNISGEISASYQNASLAAEGLENVYVIDSRALSTGTSVLMLYARDLLDAGMDVKDVVRETSERRGAVQTSFVVETLDYLHKGGRCSLLQVMGAYVFHFRPYIKMKDGVLGVAGKFRGKRMGDVFTEYIEELAQEYPDHITTRAFITHSGCAPEDVAKVREAVERNFKFKNVYETIAGSTITSHCGRGTLGLLFLNDKPIV